MKSIIALLLFAFSAAQAQFVIPISNDPFFNSIRKVEVTHFYYDFANDMAAVSYKVHYYNAAGETHKNFAEPVRIPLSDTTSVDEYDGMPLTNKGSKANPFYEAIIKKKRTVARMLQRKDFWREFMTQKDNAKPMSMLLIAIIESEEAKGTFNQL